ncbi:MAG: 7,8-didemethyl-8-hydroxy-5-deazariboflavin synthase subunit CofG [Candidatus Kariarchaeaceae archaeon]
MKFPLKAFNEFIIKEGLELKSFESIEEMISLAKEKRMNFFKKEITYSLNVFLGITKLCSNNCGYCGYKKEEAEWLHLEEAEKVIREGVKKGAKEALITSGEKPEVYSEAKEILKKYGMAKQVEYAYLLAKKALTLGMLPHTNIGNLTEEEYKMLKEVNVSAGLMLENSSERFKEKGMSHENSPSKWPKKRIKAIKAAGRAKIPLTTGILVGIGETWEERWRSLHEISKISAEFGHIQEVIVQNLEPLEGTRMAKEEKITDEEFIKIIALARIILPTEVSLQIPPNLNEKRLEECILIANDLGGISSTTHDEVNPTSPWPKLEKMKERLEEKGFSLKERLAIYPKYYSWLNDELLEKLKELKI